MCFRGSFATVIGDISNKNISLLTALGHSHCCLIPGTASSHPYTAFQSFALLSVSTKLLLQTIHPYEAPNTSSSSIMHTFSLVGLLYLSKALSR